MNLCYSNKTPPIYSTERYNFIKFYVINVAVKYYLLSTFSHKSKNSGQNQQRPHRGVWLSMCGFAVVCIITVVPVPALASDLGYALMSPNFGGGNGIALSMAQQQNSLKTAHAVALASAAAAAASKVNSINNVNQSFINAIVSQLTGLVAYKIATGIANTGPGKSGTVQSGDTTISYVNSDGQLNVTLTSPSGSTKIAVPTGG